MTFIFDIGFLPVRVWDILDILIVGYLMYRIYILLKGSIAFNIFVGVVLLYMVYWLVSVLDMDLLTVILDQFVKVGVIILVIIFQPEVRRFLLILGNTTLRQRSNFFGTWLDKNFENSEKRLTKIQEIKSALLRMSKEKTGALIVLSHNIDLESLSHSGVPINADLSQQLLQIIFHKESPLHDGAVVIDKGKILAASCVLPVTESPSLPKNAGLRHRAAVGITERSNVATFIVSEETGSIGFAFDGKLQRRLSEPKLLELLEKHYT
ncbi:MAG: diadenylate cyclase CdaA [Bacteroidetes bacterium]|nr:diadenylate cyclase CdaA [Bacteroidota bacterium]MDF1867414.1 diadenylate cyclase CdaA [Saprospiraceae bacterium]